MKKLIIGSLVMVLLFCSQSISSADESKYSIGPGDILEISVWKDESLSREVVVPPDGIISFPLVDDINVTGMSVTDLRLAVTEKLSEYVPGATVTIMLKRINSLKAYVIGKVNKPGVFDITMNTSVMQILAMAGGLDPFASPSDIHILRRTKNYTIKIPFNYKQVEKGKNLKQNILLQKGDTVVVP